MSDGAALSLSWVVRTFHQGGRELQVLRGISFDIAPGEMVALVGPSGAGKSTLLHVAGLLERPDSGDISVQGEACAHLGEAERTRLRCKALGFVYQSHHLLPEFTALENVMLPQMIGGKGQAAAKSHAQELLESIGLGERLEHRPGRLSGGEQQRVAIARSLANGPAVLLADEPTGNLDPHTSDAVFAQLQELVHAHSLAALVATHNLDLAARMDRTLVLRDGQVETAN